MCPATYLPPRVFEIIIERWQQCLALVCLIVLFVLAEVWYRRWRYGRLADNSRDLVLAILAYLAVSAGILVIGFVSFIWQDAFEQHELAAITACPSGPAGFFQQYPPVRDLVVRDAVVLTFMLLSLAALFTILRGVTAALVARRQQR